MSSSSSSTYRDDFNFERKDAYPFVNNGLWGYSVDNTTLYFAVGHPNDGLGGKVVVFRRTGDNVWGNAFEIQPSDLAIDDRFGYTLSICNKYLAISSKYKNSSKMNEGKVYVYEKTGANAWGNETIITHPEPEVNAFFGWSLAITNDYLAIGTPNFDSASGKVYVYSQLGGNSWGNRFDIGSPDSLSGQRFGWSLDMNEYYLGIGAVSDSENVIEGGRAYVFLRTAPSEWGSYFELAPSDGKEYDFFGHSIGIDDFHVIVGSRFGDEDSSADTGAAYIYERLSDNTWGSEFKISSDVGANSEYGYSVDVYDDYAVIGAPKGGTGAVYLYERLTGNIWGNESIVLDYRVLGDAEYGSAVSIAGKYVAIGAPKDDYINANNGSAYIVKIGPIDSSSSSSSFSSLGFLELSDYKYAYFDFAELSLLSGGVYESVEFEFPEDVNIALLDHYSANDVYFISLVRASDNYILTDLLPGQEVEFSVISAGEKMKLYIAVNVTDILNSLQVRFRYDLDLSSSSSSSTQIMTSSSSSSTQIKTSSSSSPSSNTQSSSTVTDIIVPFVYTPPPVSKKSGSGSGDLHLHFGGSSTPVLATSRTGVSEPDVPFPFNASWNYDDNAGFREVIYFAMRDPLSEKQSFFTYTQEFYYPGLGYAVTGLRFNSSSWPTGLNDGGISVVNTLGNFEASSPNELVITGDAQYGGLMDLIIYGDTLTLSYKDGDGNTHAIAEDITVIFNKQNPRIKINMLGFILEIEADTKSGIIQTNIYRFSFGPTAGSYLGESLQAARLGGELYAKGGIGGVFADIFNGIIDYDEVEDSIVYDPEVHNENSANDRIVEANIPNSEARTGIWGWYDSDDFNDNSAHFIPLNRAIEFPTDDIGSFMPHSRSYYEVDTYSDMNEALDEILYIPSLNRSNLLTITYDLIVSNTGYWDMCWVDPALAIDGSSPLIAHYDMEDGDGNMASDSSINGIDGAIIGDATWVCGIIGDYALEFDGSTNYVVCSDDVAFNRIEKGVAVSAWFKTDTLVGNRYIVSRYNEFSNERSWFLRMNGGEIEFTVYEDLLGVVFKSVVTNSLNLSIGTWYNVSVTFGSGDIFVYVDGAEITDVTITGTAESVASASTQDVLLGAYVNSLGAISGLWSGVLDEVRIHNVPFCDFDAINFYTQDLSTCGSSSSSSSSYLTSSSLSSSTVGGTSSSSTANRSTSSESSSSSSSSTEDESTSSDSSSDSSSSTVNKSTSSESSSSSSSSTEGESTSSESSSSSSSSTVNRSTSSESSSSSSTEGESTSSESSSSSSSSTVNKSTSSESSSSLSSSSSTVNMSTSSDSSSNSSSSAGGAPIPNMYKAYCCSDDSYIGYTDNTIGLDTYAENTLQFCFYINGDVPVVGDGSDYFDWTTLDLVTIMNCADELGPSYCVDSCISLATGSLSSSSSSSPAISSSSSSSSTVGMSTSSNSSSNSSSSGGAIACSSNYEDPTTACTGSPYSPIQVDLSAVIALISGCSECDQSGSGACSPSVGTTMVLDDDVSECTYYAGIKCIEGYDLHVYIDYIGDGTYWNLIVYCYNADSPGNAWSGVKGGDGPTGVYTWECSGGACLNDGSVPTLTVTSV